MFDELVEQLMALDDQEVTERFRALELERRRLDAELAAVTAVADQRQVWRHDGHFNVKGWLRANANWSPTEVAQCRRKARLLNTVPAVGDALLAGHIGVAQTDDLARARGNRRCGDDLGEMIDQLLMHAEQLPYQDFTRVVQRWISIADEDGGLIAAETSHEHRTVSMGAIDDALELRASGGLPLVTADLLRIFEAFTQAEFDTDVAERTRLHGADAPASLLARTAAQRRFDALVKIFGVAAANTEASGVRVPVVNIVTDQWTWERTLARHRLIDLTGDQTPMPDLSRLRCETDNGITVPPEHVLRAALFGLLRGVVTDPDGVIINMGRTRRCFTGSARVAAKLLATHCDHPGCVVPATFAQVDHVHEYAEGGRTDQANGRIECGGHNRVKHRLAMTARRDPTGQWIQHRADGTPMLPVGRRLIPEPEADPWDRWKRGEGPDPFGHLPPSRIPEPRADR